MAACERCWAEAFTRSRMFGGRQADIYAALLAEHPDGHVDTPPAETGTNQEDQ